MKKKMSNRAKVNISNAQHLRLSRKYNSIFKTAANEAEKDKAWVEKHYHGEVLNHQRYFGRVLSKNEKCYLYARCEKLRKENKSLYRYV